MVRVTRLVAITTLFAFASGCSSSRHDPPNQGGVVSTYRAGSYTCTLTAAKPRIAQTLKPSLQKASTQPARLSCEKAGTIVSSYGFSGVTSSSCAGKVYAFAGSRDGQSYVIEVDAVSGELTKVRKRG